jgi:hypothetical protein
MGEPQVGDGLKGMLKATVQGTIFEKIFYFTLVSTSVVLFLMSTVGLLRDAATAVITTVEFETRETFEFPGMFICFRHDSEKASYSPNVDNWQLPPLAGDNAHTCNANNAEFVSKIVYNAGGIITEKQCLGMKFSTDDGSGRPVSQRAVQVEERVNLITAPVPFECLLLNGEGTATASRSKALTVLTHESTVTPQNGKTSTMMMIGLFDPKVPPEDLVKENFQYFFIDNYDTMTSVYIDYDTIVDLSKTSWQVSVPKFEDHKEEAKKHYRANVASSKMDAIPGTIGASRTNRIQFLVSSFTGREMLLRKKSFSEVWSELGGCWASSILLVAIFFVHRSVVVGSGMGKTTQSTQLLRFRTAKSRKSLLGELARTAGETKDYADEQGGNVMQVVPKA